MHDPDTSQVEADRPDVVIMGGGLAGLTLALQLRQRLPELDVLVLERRMHPVPLATHKVGESTVEIGAHYFGEVLGLKDHLAEHQLKKFGFRFFFSDGRRDIHNVTELGASRPLAVSSWQIDRGLFENFLAEEAVRRGIRFEGGAIVRQVVMGQDGAPHQLSWQRAGEALQQVQARWLIDACGRASLLKRQLGLALDNPHAAHAVWFRIHDRIHIDSWSQDAEWASRCDTPTRWLSTNHLVGPGYWVWLIPLSTGSHSVGIVADPAYHPSASMDSFDKAMDWLHTHQPRLWDELDGKRDKLQDFAFFRRFSYDCKQIFSADRWALAGEAGRFLDPFYSPGSDFIAIGNTYITELVARDHEGRPLAAYTQIFEQVFRSFYDSTMALYVGQYGLFGDPEVLPTKIIWDYTYYWSVLAQLYFQDRLADLPSLSHLRDELAHCQRLNIAVQDLLQRWGAVSPRRNARQMLDQASVPWFAELNRSLTDRLDDEAFRLRLRQATSRLHMLAAEILERARSDHPSLDGQALQALLDSQIQHQLPHEPMLFPQPEAVAQPG
jgi:flavin-dependent dehydrogenase